jgi:membrane protease YdiL (CAAX protease family)
MNFFAATPLHPPSWEWQALLIVAFVVYVLVSFIRVAGYATSQAQAGRLLAAGNTPPTWSLPPFIGTIFALSVLLLLYYQAALYMIVVVLGLSLCLLETRRSAAEQFGLDRQPLGQVVKWSILICGAVIFVEVPLSEVADELLTLLHFPHPQQEAVEVFRGMARRSQIFWFLVQAVAISPLIEELFFRGFLLTFLKNRCTTWTAIILSAAIFAFAHANVGAFAQLWLLGIVLGIAYEHSGSLLLPIGIHGCWNLMTALTLLFEKGTS